MNRHPTPPADPLPRQVALHEPLDLGVPSGWQVLLTEFREYRDECPVEFWCATLLIVGGTVLCLWSLGVQFGWWS